MNAIAFHPVHGTLATVGSDGRFSFWDKDARTKLKTSEQLDQPITACCFNHNGNIFAYASSYDWSKVGAYKRVRSALVSSLQSPPFHSGLHSASSRATSTTTPRKRTTSSWGMPLRSWSLGTRNGERRAVIVCKPEDRGHWTGLPCFLSSPLTLTGAFQGHAWMWAVRILKFSALPRTALSSLYWSEWSLVWFLLWYCVKAAFCTCTIRKAEDEARWLF